MAGLDDPSLQWLPPPPMFGDPAALPPAADAGPPTPADVSGAAAPPVTPPQQDGPQTLDGAMPPAPPALPLGPPSDAVMPPPPDPGPADLGAAPPMLAPPVPAPPAGPDAISGADRDLRTVAGSPGISIRPETHADQYFGHPWDNPDQGERDAAARTMAISDPVAFAAYQQHQAESKLMAEAAARHQAEAANLQAVKDNLEARQKADAISQQKSQQILADAQTLASKSIDSRHWFTSKSVFQKIMTLGSAIVGGLVAGKTGGRNTAMDWIGKEMDDDINNQKADIENQRAGLNLRSGAVAQEFARTGDLYHAAEVVRQATYQSAISDLQTQQQDYDPRGTSFAAIGRGIQQLAAGSAQAQEGVRKTIFDEQLKVQNATREQQLANETMRHNRAEEALARTKEAREAAKDKETRTPQELQAIYPGQPVPPVPMKDKDYGSWLDNIKKGQEASLGDREYRIGGVSKAVRDADGNVVDIEYKPLTNKDGKEFTAPTTTEAEKLRNQKSGVDIVNTLVDEMVDGIKKYGGTTEFFKSPEWQQMQANNESLLLGLHTANGIEGFRPGVLEQMEHALGGQSPTKLSLLEHNAVPGLQEAKKNINKAFDAKLRSQGYTGETYSPETRSGGVELPRLSGRTFAESAPGLLDKQGAYARQNVNALLHPFDGTPDVGADPNDPNEPSGEFGETGLSVEDTKTVKELAKRFDRGTPETKRRVLQEITGPFNAGRPSLNVGIVNLLRSENPALYAEALKALPADQREGQELLDRQPALSLPPPPLGAR